MKSSMKFIALAGLFLLVGCGPNVEPTDVATSSTVTLDKYQKIQYGMTPQQVNLILGRPEDQRSDAQTQIAPYQGGGVLIYTTRIWKESSASATVIFKDERVVDFKESGLK